MHRPNDARIGNVPGGGRNRSRRADSRISARTTSATTTRASAIRVGGTPRSNAIFAMIAERPQHAPATTTLSAAPTAAPRGGAGAAAGKGSALLAVEHALHGSPGTMRDRHVVLKETMARSLLISEPPRQ